MRKAAIAATNRFDFVLSPTAPMTAFPAEWASPSRDPLNPFPHIGFTVAFNMSEQPAASVNCGYDKEGLPIGLQIVGRRFDDVGVLRTVRAFEEIRAGEAGRGPSRREDEIAALPSRSCPGRFQTRRSSRGPRHGCRRCSAPSARAPRTAVMGRKESTSGSARSREWRKATACRRSAVDRGAWRASPMTLRSSGTTEGLRCSGIISTASPRAT